MQVQVKITVFYSQNIELGLGVLNKQTFSNEQVIFEKNEEIHPFLAFNLNLSLRVDHPLWITESSVR